MITTALTFRIEHIVFQEIGLAAETGFLAALYLSIIGNAIVAEWLLWRMRRKKNTTHQLPNNYETKTVISVPAAIR
jgi:hypothetical protein